MANLWLSVGAVALGFFLIVFFLSFDTLEYQELGLNYSLISETVEKHTYRAGRYYLGIGNSFIKFPQQVQSVNFERGSFQRRYTNTALKSRTRDGLTVTLEVSFQYRLKPEKLYDLFMTLGMEYEDIFVRMAIEQLTAAATLHDAHNFFDNRTFIGQEMHNLLNLHFQEHVFADVPLFQLRTVHLPGDFEAAIQTTQVTQQEIQIAVAEQKQRKVQFETKVLKARQKVNVLNNQASGQAEAILASNAAYTSTYILTQTLQAKAMRTLMEAASWTPAQLLEYLRIRAVSEHPSGRTTIKM